MERFGFSLCRFRSSAGANFPGGADEEKGGTLPLLSGRVVPEYGGEPPRPLGQGRRLSQQLHSQGIGVHNVAEDPRLLVDLVAQPVWPMGDADP